MIVNRRRTTFLMLEGAGRVGRLVGWGRAPDPPATPALASLPSVVLLRRGVHQRRNRVVLAGGFHDVFERRERQRRLWRRPFSGEHLRIFGKRRDFEVILVG